MNLMTAAWWMTCKDLRSYFRDRMGVLLGFGLPVVIVGVFGFINTMAFAQDNGLTQTTLWVADLDQSDRSREFISALEETSLVRVRPRDGEPPESLESLRQKVSDGEAHHGLVIPAGFAERIGRQEIPTLQLVRDPDRKLEGQMISMALLQGLIQTGDEAMTPQFIDRVLQVAGLPEEYREQTTALTEAFHDAVRRLFQQAEQADKLPKTSSGQEEGAFLNLDRVLTGLIPMETTDVRPPDRPKRLTYMLAQGISGMSVMMLMFGLVACSTMLIREREQGTLPRLLLSAAPRDALLLGKMGFTIIVGCIQLAFMFSFGSLLFDVDLLASPSTLVLFSFSFIVAVSAFGMLIAAWAQTVKQADGISTILILCMSALGGAWFPIQLMELPWAAELLTKLTITRWAMDGYQAYFWNGKTWLDNAVLVPMLVLWGFALAASVLALRCYRKRYVEL